MKSKTKIIILITFGIVFALSTNIENSKKNLVSNDDIRIDYRNLKYSKISGRIRINNNWSDAETVSIVTGSGNYSDPYVIEDLVIDANGSVYGIWIESSIAHFKVKNCSVYNAESGYVDGDYYPYGMGIVLSNVSNGQLINNNFSLNNYGIGMLDCNNNSISGNTVYNNTEGGIGLGKCSYNFISNNTVNHNGQFGIALANTSSNNKISGNIMVDNDFYSIIISFNSTSNEILGNTLNNSNYGISINTNSSNNKISGNTLNNNANGIYLNDGSGTNITRNTVNSNSYYGIRIYNNNNSIISGNTVYRSEYNGISIDGKNVIVLGNNITNCDKGLENNGDNNLVSGNKIINCENGLVIWGDNNTIIGNTINNNGQSGLTSYYSDNNTIMGNHISYNGGYGIQLNYECNNNRIIENTANGNHASGIYLSFCYNNKISGNTANNNYININEAWVHGIYLYHSDNNTILGNIANNNTNGIFLEYSDNNYISGNIAYHNKLNYFNFGNGIFLLHSEKNTISGNTFNDNVGGINSENIAYSSYVNNTVSDNSYFGIVITNGGNNTISGNLVKNNTILGIALLNCSHNNISGNIVSYNSLAGIGLQDSDNNIISGNTVNNNMGAGIGLNVSEYNTIVGNTVSNNEIGIYLEFSCYNDLSGNTFMNNTVADIYEENNNSCKINPGFNLFLLVGILIGMVVIFVGSLFTVSIIQRKKPNEGKRKILSRFKFKKELINLKSKIRIKTKPPIDNQKVLQGKTLRVYWYILTHKRAGVREIQKSLRISSPGTVSYQIDKLLKASIISKSDKDGKYYVNQELKRGILGFYTHIGFLMIPRFSLYLIINVLGFIGYLIFAIIYGDKFITNPGSLFLLIFLIFGTAIFIFESIKVWKTKPLS